MSLPKTVPLKDILAVASKAPFVVQGTTRAAYSGVGEFSIVSANNFVKIEVAKLEARPTGMAETKANAMLLAHCRNNFIYLASILERLAQKAKQINNAQHAGLTIAPEDWADLHQLELEATATLEISSNVNAPV